MIIVLTMYLLIGFLIAEYHRKVSSKKEIDNTYPRWNYVLLLFLWVPLIIAAYVKFKKEKTND